MKEPSLDEPSMLIDDDELDEKTKKNTSILEQFDEDSDGDKNGSVCFSWWMRIRRWWTVLVVYLSPNYGISSSLLTSSI